MSLKVKAATPNENSKPSKTLRSAFRFIGIQRALLTLTILLASPAAWTNVEFDSTQLLLKSSDEISEIIKTKIKRAQVIQSRQEDSDDGSIGVEPEALEELKAAMRVVLSRPNQDGARANLFTRIRRELMELNAVERVLSELATEAIEELKAKDGPRRIATYVVLLENMMAELRPDLGSNPKAKEIVERIRDANIQIGEATKVQNLLRSMTVPQSPSKTAARMLDPKGSKKK